MRKKIFQTTAEAKGEGSDRVKDVLAPLPTVICPKAVLLLMFLKVICYMLLLYVYMYVLQQYSQLNNNCLLLPVLFYCVI